MLKRVNIQYSIDLENCQMKWIEFIQTLKTYSAAFHCLMKLVKIF